MNETENSRNIGIKQDNLDMISETIKNIRCRLELYTKFRMSMKNISLHEISTVTAQELLRPSLLIAFQEPESYVPSHFDDE